MYICGMMLIDMHGVRYANNLLKNPAMTRLSGKNEVYFSPQKLGEDETIS